MKKAPQVGFWRMMRRYLLLFRSMITKKWLFFVAGVSFSLLLIALATVALTAKIYDLDEMQQMQFASTLYEAKGQPALTMGDSNREHIALEDIQTPLLVKTVLAVEDSRFYEHNGVDYYGIVRALTVNARTLKPAEGGSTITMQVARNTILHSRKKRMVRKIREVFISWNLERRYSKDEILESYLNYIYLGNNVRGIKMAAKIYFDKDLSTDKLEPHEIAMLASLPKGPDIYNPYKNPKLAKERRNTVLAVMANSGLITIEEKKKYQAADLGVNPDYLSKHIKNDPYQAYVDLVVQEAAERYEMEAEEFVNGGYKVYTALRPSIQTSLEESLDANETYQGQNNLNSGAIMLDPSTGEIVSVGGGRNYKHGYTHGALLRRQPGSTIKPITVYSPLIEEHGYNEYTQVSDDPYHIGDWKPQNADQTTHGSVYLKTAVAQSYNITAARLLHEVVGEDKAYTYGSTAGLTLDEKDRSPAALSLGGLTYGVTTKEMAEAYSALANGGEKTEAHAIRQIVDADGNEIQPKTERKTIQWISKKSAYYMTRLLQYAVDHGTGNNAKLADGRVAAGKTGTTQNSDVGWFVGYTPELVMAVMVYQEDPTQQSTLAGGTIPAHIFQKTMSRTLEGEPIRSFRNPGVPLPQPPFQLQQVQDLQGSYTQSSQSISLTWSDQGKRVAYEVQRSIQNQDWETLTTVDKGSYTDTLKDADLPTPSEDEEEWAYSYRVIAIDQQSGKTSSPSNLYQVTLTARIIDDETNEEEPPPTEGEGSIDPEHDL
ncbi:transglycosylase domain-containing protein [Mechercharimyces sp. CAU 1602]|uniref:transglycosylase domain-containing protein n=1 Tax=Mechercharimyces sp. CAU 1602 TaxID=2973933 RepID=UPI002162AD71|nr:transglycosylase domain-containing protein [Mechercharimyces sp. CAU 1602]MCS1351549.1 penicillin-binding protein [Mechercharimyces sp. CAU 1602]